MAKTQMQWIVRHNSIPGYGKGMTGRARAELKGFGDDIVKDLRKDMRGPKSGRIYMIRGKRHQASAPGETPAVLSTGTSRSLRVVVKGTGAEFEIKAGGASAWLQQGTNRMKPRKFVREYLRERTPEFVRRVRAGVAFRETRLK